MSALSYKKRVSKEFLHKKINEEAPTNAMGASGSNPATGSVDTFDPMLFRKKRKSAHKEVERSKMLRRRFADYTNSPQK